MHNVTEVCVETADKCIQILSVQSISKINDVYLQYFYNTFPGEVIS